MNNSPFRLAENTAVRALAGVALAVSLATAASAQTTAGAPSAATQSGSTQTAPAAPAIISATSALPQKDANGPGGSPLASTNRGRTFAPQFDRALTPQQMSDAWNRELNRLGLPSANDSLASRYCCF